MRPRTTVGLSAPKRHDRSGSWRVLFAGCLLACAAPTLPLPPPAAPQVSMISEGQYLLRGERSVEPFAIVVLYNQNPTFTAAERVQATEADAEGTWQDTIRATPGDLIDIWQEAGTNKSPPSTIQIPR